MNNLTGTISATPINSIDIVNPICPVEGGGGGGIYQVFLYIYANTHTSMLKN